MLTITGPFHWSFYAWETHDFVNRGNPGNPRNPRNPRVRG